MAESKNMLNWRAKQKRGAIMKPATFAAIVKKAMGTGMDRLSATKIAGKAYWQSANSKYAKAKGNKYTGVLKHA